MIVVVGQNYIMRKNKREKIKTINYKIKNSSASEVLRKRIS